MNRWQWFWEDDDTGLVYLARTGDGSKDHAITRGLTPAQAAAIILAHDEEGALRSNLEKIADDLDSADEDSGPTYGEFADRLRAAIS